MGTPTFSVIIPALNEEKFLPHLLVSLSQQSYKDFEVIVVDGKSKDKTIEVANTYVSKLPALSVVVADHASLPYQRNVGAKTSRGEWLIFIDADSILLPYALDRFNVFIRQHQPDMFTCWFRPDSEIANDAVTTLLTMMFIEGSKIAHRQYAPGMFAAIREDVFKKVKGYDEDHPFLEDQDISQRILKKGFDIKYLRETLYIWSMRRFRKQGTIKILQAYSKAILPIIFSKKIPKNMKGYDMGGHVFTNSRKDVKPSILKDAEKKIKEIMRELFE